MIRKLYAMLVGWLNAICMTFFGQRLYGYWKAGMEGDPPFICKVEDNNVLVLAYAFGADLSTGRNVWMYRGPCTRPVITRWFHDYIGIIDLRKLPVNIPEFEVNTGLIELKALDKKYKGEDFWKAARKRIEAALTRNLTGGTPMVRVNTDATFGIRRKEADGPEDDAVMKSNVLKYLAELEKGEFKELIIQRTNAALNLVFGSVSFLDTLHLPTQEKNYLAMAVMEILNYGGCYLQDAKGNWVKMEFSNFEALDKYGIECNSMVVQSVKAAEDIMKAINEMEAAAAKKQELLEIREGLKGITPTETAALGIVTLENISVEGMGMKLAAGRNAGGGEKASGKNRGKSPDKQ